ncbi:MAG: FtsX-like permease family protein [Deltaproteobacteria bacterium]|nr:FtsX-like permease family protein [Deltaproteobacteria bacterium]
MGKYLLIGGRNLIRARRRSLILGLALGAVTMLLVLLLALSQGLSDNMIRSATTLAAGHVNVAGFYKTTPSDAAPVLLDTARVRALVQKSAPGIATTIDRARGWAKLVSAESSLLTTLIGVDPAQEQRLGGALDLAEERSYRPGGGTERRGDLSRLGQPGTAVVFSGQAKRLKVQIGDSVTVVAQSLKGAANSKDLIVTAIVEDIGMLSIFSVLVSKTDVLDLYQLRDDSTGAVMVYLEDIAQAGPVMTTLRRALGEAGYEVMDHDPSPFMAKLPAIASEDWTGQRLDVTTWDDEISFISWVITAFDWISVFLVSILAGIIAIGIINTMWMSVRERTPEVGTMRAIGMGRRQVLMLFMTEALLLALVATTAGAFAGAGLASGIDALRIELPFDAARAVLMSPVLHLALRPAQIPLAIGAITLVTGLAALWPASGAARLQPVTAIQSG